MGRLGGKLAIARVAACVATLSSLASIGCGVGGIDPGHEADASSMPPADAADRDGPATDAETPSIDASPAVDAIDPCTAIPGFSYQLLSTVGDVTDRPAAEHADLNIELRGWSPTGGELGLIEIDGPTDSLAPQLRTLFEDGRLPAFAANYRVNDWNWDTNSPGGPITTSEVTLSGMTTTPGEIIALPDSGYDIGDGADARVLFADGDSITLKYTRDDNVVYGYTVHIVGICVEPTLRAAYDSCNDAGRADLPAIVGGAPVGRARAAEIKVSIRDTGAFMDPRARKDWWQDF